MTFEKLEQNELERMEFNAFKVCNELSLRIDGATEPKNYMKAYTLEKSEDLFFNNHADLKKYLPASEKNKVPLPRSHYFTLLQGFIKSHVEVGKNILSFCDIHAQPSHAFTVLSLAVLGCMFQDTETISKL